MNTGVNSLMSEFLDRFMCQYYPKLNERAESFRFVFETAEKRGFDKPEVLETGTCRSGDWKGDGCSTIMLGDYCFSNQGHLYTIDIDPRAIVTAHSMTKPFHSCIEFTVCNSLEVLRWHRGFVDILYLDSYDWGPNQIKPCQSHNLQEMILAYPCMSHDSIIIIDDTKLPEGGKGGRTVPWLKDRGWKVAFEDYQTVLLYDSN